MKIIKVIQQTLSAGPDGVHHPGDEYLMPEAEATAMQKAGAVQIKKGKVKAVKSTAADEPITRAEREAILNRTVKAGLLAICADADHEIEIARIDGKAPSNPQLVKVIMGKEFPAEDPNTGNG